MLNTPSFSTLPPLSLYVHFPWCIKKCPYCDFNSHELKSDLQEQKYIAALLADLDEALPLIWGRPIVSIFMGGGTPSLFSARAIDDLISGLRARLKCLPDMEVTLEANPGTFEKEKFADFASAGINRLSLGIQSFNETHLKALGRVHDRAQALAAAEHSLAIFKRVNLDLMYGLPEQSVEQSAEDLATALSLHPEHLSLYQLTLEPNTLFHLQPPKLPEEDLIDRMQDHLETQTARHGYMHYEISAYAKPDGMARHNVNYWEFGDYLGIGAGAHSKISSAEQIMRRLCHKHPPTYLQGKPVHSETLIKRNEVGFEFMLNALRLHSGFASNLFQERTGYALSLIEKPLQEAEKKGLIHRSHSWIKPTPLGQRFLNDLQSLFL